MAKRCSRKVISPFQGYYGRTIKEIALEDKCRELEARNALLQDALETLVERYIKNKGTEYQFVSCITPTGTPDFWEKAINVLSSSPADASLRE